VREHCLADLEAQLLDPLAERLQCRDEREHNLPPSVRLEVAGAAVRSPAQPRQQLFGLAPTAITVAFEERAEALLAEVARVHGAGVALQEAERDRRVDLAEHLRRARPEALQLRLQLSRERLPRMDQVLATATQCPQRLRPIAVRDQHAEPVTVGTRELGERESVEVIALAARRGEPRSHRHELVGVHRDHRQASIQQPLDQQPIGPIDRQQHDAKLKQPAAQRLDPTLVVTVPASLDDPAVLVDYARGVLLAGPIDPSEPTVRHDHHSLRRRLTVVGSEVPWRMLTDGALRRDSLLPLGAPRRNAGRRWSQIGPLHGPAQKALSRHPPTTKDAP
jgi:hypothetical protein